MSHCQMWGLNAQPPGLQQTTLPTELQPANLLRKLWRNTFGILKDTKGSLRIP